jgi:hypothetical protein
MNSRYKQNAAVERLIEVFGNWLSHRREIREIRGLDSGDFARIAQELRVMPDELDLFVRQGSHAIDELPRLLQALGIDEKALARAEPMVLRDMNRVCAVCRQKRQCNRDLDAGTSVGNYAGYCPNASTIDALEQNEK